MGGEGVCGLGDFCGCFSPSEKANLAFSCQAMVIGRKGGGV
mgnify:CR=1 FL=1